MQALQEESHPPRLNLLHSSTTLRHDSQFPELTLSVITLPPTSRHLENKTSTEIKHSHKRCFFLGGRGVKYSRNLTSTKFKIPSLQLFIFKMIRGNKMIQHRFSTQCFSCPKTLLTYITQA